MNVTPTGTTIPLSEDTRVAPDIGPLSGMIEPIVTAIKDLELNSIFDMMNCPPGSDCYKTNRSSYLLDKYNKEKIKYNNAPIDLSRAEKNYYVYNEGNRGGEQAYNSFIIDRFSKTAKEFKKNSIDKQQEFMGNLSQALKQYQAAVLFKEHTKKLLKMRENEQTDLIKNINYYKKIVQTSERKVVYENKNMDSLYMYRRVMIFIYYGLIVCFIVFGNFIPDQLYKKYSVWLVILILIIFPIILNIIIMWLFTLYDTVTYWFSEIPHKDVYSNLKNPYDEKPPAPPITSDISNLS
jgi:hypothetical protein